MLCLRPFAVMSLRSGTSSCTSIIFGLDWMETMKKLREMPKEQHEALLLEYKEMGVVRWGLSISEKSI